MEKIKKIYVEDGMIVVKETINKKEAYTRCHELDIKGPSQMKSDENGNIWIETKELLEKIVRISPNNLSVVKKNGK